MQDTITPAEKHDTPPAQDVIDALDAALDALTQAGSALEDLRDKYLLPAEKLVRRRPLTAVERFAGNDPSYVAAIRRAEALSDEERWQGHRPLNSWVWSNPWATAADCHPDRGRYDSGATCLDCPICDAMPQHVAEFDRPD